MKGKTLVATMPSYCVRDRQGVHVVTISAWRMPVGHHSRVLGLTSGCILVGQTPAEHREMATRLRRTLRCGITKFGFDYLRDNVAWVRRIWSSAATRFVVVDEVDSILIDEARTISGPTAT